MHLRYPIFSQKKKKKTNRRRGPSKGPACDSETILLLTNELCLEPTQTNQIKNAPIREPARENGCFSEFGGVIPGKQGAFHKIPILWKALVFVNSLCFSKENTPNSGK